MITDSESSKLTVPDRPPRDMKDLLLKARKAIAEGQHLLAIEHLSSAIVICAEGSAEAIRTDEALRNRVNTVGNASKQLGEMVINELRTLKERVSKLEARR